MKNTTAFAAVGLLVSLLPVSAFGQSTPVVVAQRVESGVQALPINTLVLVTPAAEITSKKMKEGTTREFLVVEDVVQDGFVVIPRGSRVKATVTWRTGKGIGGKSAKFELTFDSVRVGGNNWELRGTHRQEGRGNTAGALLGSMIITGRSAVMTPGQMVNVFTAEEVPFRSEPQPSAARPEASNGDDGSAASSDNERSQQNVRPPAEINISTNDD